MSWFEVCLRESVMSDVKERWVYPIGVQAIAVGWNTFMTVWASARERRLVESLDARENEQQHLPRTTPDRGERGCCRFLTVLHSQRSHLQTPVVPRPPSHQLVHARQRTSTSSVQHKTQAIGAQRHRRTPTTRGPPR